MPSSARLPTCGRTARPRGCTFSRRSAWQSRTTMRSGRRRPAGWRTLETVDVAGCLRAAREPLLIDCLGTWLAAVLDGEQAWERPGAQVHTLLETRLSAAVAELRRETGLVVLVTNEVGLGVVPAHRSGRLFRDLLGLTNQRLAAECDEVHLVVAGRVLVL
ncbi:MAG: bifunctional adenosylcobinamide kinase/adenosylcobinamide-phosphate guanylyltransferase [Actinobacteria bacterium]|nr:bifunctional adenosylcobinamide kinase/adenosylcobinamide-phosphate guanylyltransferase [Actinomycetota bacterium]